MSSVEPPRAGFDDRRLEAIRRQIVGICIHLGLTPSDSDDLAQDVWVWLLRSNRIAEATSTPWVARVVINFVRRHWRRQKRVVRLAEALRLLSRSAPNVTADTEARLFLDRLQKRASQTQSSLIALMRQGLSLTEAANKLGLPAGSRQFHRNAIRGRARRLAARRDQTRS